MTDEVVFLVATDGGVRFLYDDAVAELRDLLGEAQVARASHVEPEGTFWFVDLSPVRGPRLGPFSTRTAALQAEKDWLLTNGLPFPGA